MKNPIGIISMQFIRPFAGKDLHYFQKAADLGFDFVELLVPEPEDDLSIARDLYLENARRLLNDGCVALAPFGTTGFFTG